MPPALRKLDERSRGEIEKLLAAMVAEGYSPFEIYRVVNDFPLPAVVLNMRKLVEYRLSVAAKTLTKSEKTVLEPPNTTVVLPLGLGSKNPLNGVLGQPGWVDVAFERYRAGAGRYSLAECFVWAQQAEKVSA